MSEFKGTGGNDSVTPSYISYGVISTPPGSTPGNEDDLIYTYNGTDFIDGGGGNDTIYPGLDSDSAYGGVGNDFISDYYDNFGNLSTGNDSLWGDDGNDTLQGGNGNDLLNGGLGTDYLYGDDGNDILHGGPGTDYLYGGIDSDTYFVYDPEDSVYESTEQNGGYDLLYTATSRVLPEYFEELFLTLNSTADLNGIGNDEDNYIEGNSGRNAISGLDGNDSLYGKSGNDTVSGEAGDDTLDGGLGDDSMSGGNGSDTYYVDSIGDYVEESSGAGYDRVFTSVSYTLSSNVEYLFLTGRSGLNGTGNDLENGLWGNDGANAFFGLGGNDYIESYAGSDSLYGGDGADFLDGGLGGDYMEGGAGDDRYKLDSASDVIYETSAGASGGTDTVELSFSGSWTLGDNIENLRLYNGAVNGTGNAADNDIRGTSSANTLTGSGGNDSLWGRGGDDILDGGNGVDLLDGESGNDTYYVENADDFVREYYEFSFDDEIYLEDSGGTDSVFSTADFILGLYVENLTLTGASNINGTGNGWDNTLTGNNGNNALNGLGGNDRLTGGLGNDSLNGGADQDTMIGGGGNDTYYVDQTTDVISETLTGTSGGTDTVYANASFTLGVNVENLYLFGDASINASGNDGINDISGTIGNNYLRGFALADTLRAGSGNDTLDGGTGADAMTGGQGNDTYYVSNAQDTTIETFTGTTGGTDTVYATVGFTLATNVENLFLTGTAASNGIGNALGNAISGDAFVNSLRGLAGNDTFQSGAGADILIGGTGNDTFRFTTTNGSNPSARDIIRAGDSAVAFEKPGATLGDRIDLALVDANTGSGGTQHFTYGTSTGVGRLWATELGSNTIINGNTDGDSAIEFQIAIEDGSVRSSAYSGADFLLA